MPLLDHFHPPLSLKYGWESFYSNWATRLADAINAQLPPDFFAEELCRFPDTYRVSVIRSTASDPGTVSLIELITPANKEHVTNRRAFAERWFDLMRAGFGLVMVDIVTSRARNLHNEVAALVTSDPKASFRGETPQYAVAYRTQTDGGRQNLAFWPHRLTVGEQLPTLPLFLASDLCIPVDLEATYAEACRRRRII